MLFLAKFQCILEGNTWKYSATGLEMKLWVPQSWPVPSIFMSLYGNLPSSRSSSGFATLVCMNSNSAFCLSSSFEEDLTAVFISASVVKSSRRHQRGTYPKFLISSSLASGAYSLGFLIIPHLHH